MMGFILVCNSCIIIFEGGYSFSDFVKLIRTEVNVRMIEARKIFSTIQEIE